MLRYRLSRPNPIPTEGIKHVMSVIESGDYYRYNTASKEYSEIDLLEKEICEYVDVKYALAVNSCGSGLYITMKSLNTQIGDEVLMSAFTYTAVPSAVVHVGAKPILVECNEDYTLDINDLINKITPKTKGLLISHMRGHVSNMLQIQEICKKNHIWLIEDCAHTYGGFYKGLHTGLYGDAAVFSTQSHKMLNAGEGGIIITNTDDIIAKAVLYAGSQEKFWRKHWCKSEKTDGLELYIPNVSMRMSNISAAIIRVQLPYIDKWRDEYYHKFSLLNMILKQTNALTVVDDIEGVERCYDTIQFRLNDTSQVEEFIQKLETLGIDVKLFRSSTNPRYYKNWKYIDEIDAITLKKTDTILSNSCDLRLPLWLSEDEVRYIGNSIIEVLECK